MLVSNEKRLFAILSGVFLTVEAAIGVMIHTIEDKFPFSLKYLSVVLACLFCIIFAKRGLSYLFTQCALFFTAISDYFLIFRDSDERTVAMMFFSVVQVCYFLRLYFEEKDAAVKKAHVILRISICVLVLVLTSLILGKKCDALALISMFYYSNLVLNTVFAYFRFESSYLIAIGLTLFIICDTAIGLSALSEYMPVDKGSLIYRILHPSFDLAWACYLPSQALIAISLLPQRMEKSTENP